VTFTKLFHHVTCSAIALKHVSFLPCFSVCWYRWSIVHLNPHWTWHSLTGLCWNYVTCSTLKNTVSYKRLLADCSLSFSFY